MLEIESLAALDEALSGNRSLRGVRLQDLDLTEREDALLSRTDCEGLVVLGGRMSERLEEHLRARGALVFPSDPRAPVDPYRATLYTADELYDGLREVGYEATPDARAYRWFQDGAREHDAFVTLLRAIHDDSVNDALTDLIDGLPAVGVMGGHALTRGSEEYERAARLGHALAGEEHLVLTGGGPGAMEAANLGALAADTPCLDEALERLAEVPGFRPDISAWAGLALDVREDLLAAGSGRRPRSIGIPTWFYGHEPPNVFADHIAKFFSNAIREDGLIARSRAGVIVLPGAAGTVQEVFQAATRLYYGTPEEGTLPRLVLVGESHWREELPAWPMLTALADGRAMAGAIHLVEDIEDAVAAICAG